MDPLLPGSCERQSSADVLALEIVEVAKDLVFVYPTGKAHEDVAHADSQAADARSSAALPRLDLDS